MRFRGELIVGVDGIGRKGTKNVGIKLFLVHKYSGSKNWFKEISSMEGSRDLFLCKDWAKIDRINFSIVIISPFWIDIPTSG